jgi:hypothetical protein
MNGIVVAIVRWPDRWVCWNLNWGQNGRMNWGDARALSWTLRRIAGIRPCGKLPFGFSAKFCIIDVPYFRDLDHEDISKTDE